MNQLESILSNDALAQEIARKVPLLQSGKAIVVSGGTESATETGGMESATETGTTENSAPDRSAESERIVQPVIVKPESVSADDARLAVGNAVSAAGLNEAIVRRFGRPVLMVRNDTFEIPASDVWKAILFPYKSRLDAALPCVGRVEIVSAFPPYLGTAWMVTENIAVTNRHVALEFAQRNGNGFEIRRNPVGQQMRVRVDFKEEYLQTVPFEAEITEVLFVSEPNENEPDIAFVRLKAPGERPLPRPLPLFDGQLRQNQKVAIIGYPAEDSRNGAEDQARIFANIFDVKRLAPGEITNVNGGFVFTHDCTTLGGNSGSPVIDIETGSVVGLHFAGEFLLNNYAVKAPVIRDILQRIESNPIFVSPLAAPPLETFEAKIEDVQGRDGYVSEFLGAGEFEVPLPEFGDGLGKLAVVAKQNESGIDKFMLDYTHFSIAMHEKRRMAIFTASNIDGAQSRKIKRKKDKWGFDPRISKDFQLGNDLYAGNDLDRGHLVRRLDPVWGSETEAQRAEIDTFFFTNCSPQHSGFNQKTWLSLEEYLLDNVDTRDFKACIFTGPIFSDDDRPYRDALLPLAYWKVAVMIHDTRNELSATAYIISQRELVSNMEFVFGQFKTYQTSIREVERRTNLDFGELKNFDPLGQQESVVFRELPALEAIRL